MRTRTFEVPVDIMGDFARILEEGGLDNTIDGVADNDDILVSVDYEPEERYIVGHLHQLIDDYNEDRDEDDEDEEDDEDVNY